MQAHEAPAYFPNPVCFPYAHLCLYNLSHILVNCVLCYPECLFCWTYHAYECLQE
jgi:hypothetical protein